MLERRLRSSLGHVGQALREPEAFAWRWHRREALYAWWVFAALGVTAVAGTTLYGLMMGLAGGPERMLRSAFLYSLAAGTAWALPLPALYILNSLTGSRLRASTTFLAALVTTSWGGLAMIAALPVAWFFTVAVSQSWVMLAVHLAVLASVGVAMTDVFARILERLEPERGRWPAFWLVLVGAIGGELFYAFGLFSFSFAA